MSETDKAFREALGLLKGWGQQYGIELRSVEMQIPETQDFPRVHELEHITDEQTSTPRSSLTATLTVLRGWAEAHSIELQGVELRVSTKMQAHRFVHEPSELLEATNDDFIAGSDTTTTTTTTTVAGSVATITVVADRATFSVGDSAGATATLRDDDGNVAFGRAVTWIVSDRSIVVIEVAAGHSAVLRGRAAGTAIITASSEGKSGSATVTVQ